MGDVRMAADVPSPQLNNTRNVAVYLPPSYSQARKRYPVLYMHDGQNLFDERTSFAGSEWRVDETMQASANEAIVIGLWNTTQRASEYTPFTNWWKGTGEAYLAFIIDTLKPMIDGTYRTQADAPNTAIIGSSLGGLISLYAFFAHPDVFGLCGALSPALWPGAGEIYKIVQSAPNNPGRVYIDNGAKEPSAKRMVDVLSGKGYMPDVNLKYISERGGQHNEAAWARRFPGAVKFLLG